MIYANIDFATRFGVSRYAQVCFGPQGSFLGERLFVRRAYGVEPLGCPPELVFSHANVWGRDKGSVVDLGCESEAPFSPQELLRLEGLAFRWIDDFARRTNWDDYSAIGLTSTFEQTSASIALLRAVRDLHPEIVTVLGGANCEGEMADGLQSLQAPVDFLFSGECEEVFPDFLDNLTRGPLPRAKVIRGSPNRRLELLPRPDFSEYFQQVQPLLVSGQLNLADLMIVYESSRGCWWGEKQHCTFCGLNGEGMTSRSKAATSVIDDLVFMSQKYGVNRFLMADNIMPHEYFASLVPQLSAMNTDLQLFYEQKANLTMRNIVALMSAGITAIQPGIESLSTPLLRRMRKGVSASQNIMLLRYAMAAGMYLEWNLLWGFPGDSVLEYSDMSELLPLLCHLQPPSGLWHISLDRFSPYHVNPTAFGIENLRPFSCYQQIYPPGC